jgi:hypothetical protein
MTPAALSNQVWNRAQPRRADLSVPHRRVHPRHLCRRRDPRLRVHLPTQGPPVTGLYWWPVVPEPVALPATASVSAWTSNCQGRSGRGRHPRQHPAGRRDYDNPISFYALPPGADWADGTMWDASGEQMISYCLGLCRANPAPGRRGVATASFGSGRPANWSTSAH